VRKSSFLLAILLFAGISMNAQVGINTDNSLPDNSAILDVRSTQAGFLIPRLTQTQIALIANPADGLQVYCTTDSKWYIFTGTYWKEVALGSGIIIPFICGASITVNHVPGNVAPVMKTVTYGTVTNIPGEPAKCWITRNLGASQQATAVTDGTETSAGWYWQFNRKQGYQYTSTRLPATTWISSISESSDWIIDNDPCATELGTGWRIPTLTEWNNVDAGGNWTNYNGSWSSALKIHAAGTLGNSDGILINRGAYGNYWSSTQSSVTNGWFIFMSSNASATYGNSKAYGFSLRCVRDN
jgi:hypothetical protein